MPRCVIASILVYKYAHQARNVYLSRRRLVPSPLSLSPFLLSLVLSHPIREDSSVSRFLSLTRVPLPLSSIVPHRRFERLSGSPVWSSTTTTTTTTIANHDRNVDDDDDNDDEDEDEDEDEKRFRFGKRRNESEPTERKLYVIV